MQIKRFTGNILEVQDKLQAIDIVFNKADLVESNTAGTITVKRYGSNINAEVVIDAKMFNPGDGRFAHYLGVPRSTKLSQDINDLLKFFIPMFWKIDEAGNVHTSMSMNNLNHFVSGMMIEYIVNDSIIEIVSIVAQLGIDVLEKTLDHRFIQVLSPWIDHNDDAFSIKGQFEGITFPIDGSNMWVEPNE